MGAGLCLPVGVHDGAAAVTDDLRLQGPQVLRGSRGERTKFEGRDGEKRAGRRVETDTNKGGTCGQRGDSGGKRVTCGVSCRLGRGGGGIERRSGRVEGRKAGLDTAEEGEA